MTEIMLARHFETEKNVAEIHGRSSLDSVTRVGEVQAYRLAGFIKKNGQLKRIVWTASPQAASSARLLSSLSGITLAGPLSLPLVNLGAAEGLSNEELSQRDPVAFKSLDLFRARVFDVSQLTVPDMTEPLQLETEIVNWWRDEEKKVIGSLVVGSQSTLHMIYHLLAGTLPSTGRYMSLGIPHGSALSWRMAGGKWETVPDTNSADGRWPEVTTAQVLSSSGQVALSHHHSGWAPSQTAVVFCPGYFGGSRHGPYGLYTRLAKDLAFHGFHAVTVDYLGTGDSAPVGRTFDGDVESVRTAMAYIAPYVSKTILIGHSMGAAVALDAAMKARATGGEAAAAIGLAPLCRLDDLRGTMLSTSKHEALLYSGRTYRHGLPLDLDYIRRGDDGWMSNRAHLSLAISSPDDLYMRRVDLSDVKAHLLIPGADHNFSHPGNYEALVSGLLEHLQQSK